MIRLIAFTLIVILVAIQLSTTECKKPKPGKGKKKKGCKFNMESYKADETILTYKSLCVALVCRKGKQKVKERKKGGKGKGKKKYTIVPEAITDCFPSQCIDIPCGGGRCSPPITQAPSANCEDQSPACPTNWECTAEHYTEPDTGCTKCRCKLDDQQYESNCGPVDPPCPQDCGIKVIVDEKTGCTRCICDPEDSGNPFEPPPPHGGSNKDGPPSVVSWNDGCNNCTCMDGTPICTLKGCVQNNTSDDLPLCKNGCTKEKVEVCGSDGITYDNACMVEFAKLCRGKEVEVSHTGPCVCPACNKRRYDPVCGDDCKTYANACTLKFENCEHRKDVKQVKKGSCEGDKNKNNRPKRGMPGRIRKKVNLFANKENYEIMQRKKKKSKKCEYNGKKYKEDSKVDLEINCSQLKCIKGGKLEIQYINGCKCDMA